MLRIAPVAAAFMVAADASGGPETKLIEYGIIGALLLTYIWWSRADKEKSDAKWDATNAQLFEVVESHATKMTEATDAIRDQTRELNDLNLALRERPCMVDKEKARR